MKYFLNIGLLLLVLAGCQDIIHPEPPVDLLPKDKMVQILADAYISNASRSKSVNNRILRTKGVQLDSLLYSKHDVDSLNFAESNAYYASNLDMYTEIISEVEKLLKAKKDGIDSIMDLDKKNIKTKKDSITSASFQRPVVGELTDPVQDDDK